MIRKTKIIKRRCKSCKREYSVYHPATFYCNVCYEVKRTLDYIKGQDRDIKRFEDYSRSFEESKPEIVKDNDEFIFDEIVKNGKIEGDSDFQQKEVVIRDLTKTKNIPVYDDDEDWELMKRVARLKPRWK